MKNNFINNILTGYLVIGLLSCSNDKPDHQHHVIRDSATFSDLNPGGILSNVNTVRPQSGKKIINVNLEGVVNYDTRQQLTISSRVQGRVEKLYVKYNFQKVGRGQKLMDIYSAELASAQRELLLLKKTGEPRLMSAAKKKLELLGMPGGAVEEVLRTEKTSYHVPVYSAIEGYIVEPGGDGTETGSTLKIREGGYVNAGEPLFNVYKSGGLVAEFYIPSSLQKYIDTSKELLFHHIDNKNDLRSGKIALMEPVFRNGQTFALARMYAPGTDLIKGELLRAIVPVSVEGGWWLPVEAVYREGSFSAVFRKQANTFKAYKVNVRFVAGDQVLIDSPIENWEVASNASYLIDSDSFINAKEIENEIN